MIISNGLGSSLGIAWAINLLRKRLIICFHGDLDENPLQGISGLIKKLCESIDLIIVNSGGSYNNVQPIILNSKIVINEHCAEDLFFSDSPKPLSTKPFVIFYVGRLDEEKLCSPLIDLATKFRNNDDYLFLFAGVGEYASRIKNLEKSSNNIRNLGYINDRIELKKLYLSASVVWSFADETYLALPAIEALACGRPIIIPKIAALRNKIKQKIEIDKNLVPSEIGWLVDPFNPHDILRLIIGLREQGIKIEMNQACRDYAMKRYSRKNLENTVTKIEDLLS